MAMKIKETELYGVLIIEPSVEGFAHGFCVLSDTALFHYKCSDFYAPQCEGGILWSDPDVAIKWPLDSPIVSEKDAGFSCLKDIAEDKLPSYFQN